MPSTVTLRLVYAYGHRAGWLEEHDDGWFIARALNGRLVGTFSTERRSLDAISQHLLQRLYRPPQKARFHERAAG